MPAKVYEVDPMVCPEYGGDMKVIAIIEDPDELRRILRHLVKMGRSPPGFDPDRLNVSADFVLAPAEISCPTLNLVAQQEYEDFGATRRWAEQCDDRIQNPNRKLLVTPADEGADTRAVGTDLRLMNQLAFDWLDATL